VLQLAGEGAWAQGGRIAFGATVQVPRDHYAQLAPVLRLIAVERARGRFQLSLQ
jgi:hypothetical protein